jgi:uncharacterized protein (DUF2236 family)
VPNSQPWIPPVPGPAEAAAGLLAGVAGRAASPIVRGAIQGQLHRVFQGDDESAALPTATAEDPGWFGPDSVTWRVHADASMFVAGIAALAFQALHPLAMAGVADHSDFRADPLGRLRRTAGFVGTTAYGTSVEAAQACAIVRSVHGRVVGHAPDGRPYAANDPELLNWVHVAEFATFAAAHRRFGADPMSNDELDRYVGEVARIGAELGDPSPPRSWAELDDALEHHRPNLCVNEQSRTAWRFLSRAHLVLPPPARPAYQLLFAGAIACLPPWARRLWGVSRPSTAELAACRGLVRGIGALLGEPPRVAEATRSAAA